jgi:hypothetical protein
MADAGMMVERVAHANVNAEIADMCASARAAGSGACPSADWADLRACANLRLRGAPEKKHGGKYRSRQRFHFLIL